MDKKPTAKLENWSMYFNGEIYFVGNAYGHSRHWDGTRVRTTQVLKIERKDEAYFVETLNTIYYLGIHSDDEVPDWLRNSQR